MIIPDIFVVVAIFTLLQAPFACYYRVRRRGYSPPEAFLIMLLVTTLLFGSLLLLSFGLAKLRLGTITSIGHLGGCIGALGAIAAVGLVLPGLRRLPERRGRAWVFRLPFTGQERSDKIMFYFVTGIRYSPVLLLIAIFILFSVCTFFVHDYSFRKQLVVSICFFLPAVAGIWFVRWRVRRRTKQWMRDRLFDPGKDPFVLYIRSFNVEIDTFGTLPVPRRPNKVRSRSFDQYFAAATKELIGPLVALGSPIDHWLDGFMWRNAPGARREYVNDETWKVHFGHKLDKCVAVFLQSGVTENIDYELGEIIRKGYASKLFIMTRPKMPFTYRKIELPRWGWLKEIPVIKWETFAALLTSCGYSICFGEPAAGSVITFGEDNNALLLGLGMNAPGELIACVKGRLDTLGKGGQS